MKQKHIQHLYWRAGFGILPGQQSKLSSFSKKEVIDHLFKESRSLTPLIIDTSDFNIFTEKRIKNNKKLIQKFIQQSLKRLQSYNVLWLERLANPKELLRERMTLFWANHFACRDNNIFFVQQYNNTLREHALGDFRQFVKAISKEPAMLKYLNNKQNVKRSPNENFARELMELFTLGTGNYSEEDIKESARAFTGYFHDIKGSFRLRKLKHDYGLKTFFGKSGYFNGDDIIDIICEEKQCAQFICEKIYRYFVNENIERAHIDEMVNVFYPKYNIEGLMHHVFMSDWFYDEKHIGTKIKSPVDFLIGMNNTVSMNFNKPKQLIFLQKALGQLILSPPNVAGWKGGKQWIDSNTILLRLRLPSLLLNSGHISLAEIGDFKDKFRDFIKRGVTNKIFDVESNWEQFHKNYNAVETVELENYLLATSFNSGTDKFMTSLNKVSKRDRCIQIMSLPEYQMC
mgnify:CR=1 FL=1